MVGLPSDTIAAAALFQSAIARLQSRGDLKSAGTIGLPELIISPPLEVGQIVAVALDGKPLATGSIFPLTGAGTTP